MATEVSPVPHHWAILIGINFYASPLTSLKGCVHDVNIIEEHLSGNSTPVNITTFRASAPASDPSSPLRLVDERASWPTFENVTHSLEKVTTEASPGDFVYIHYSGHGTQTKPSPSAEYSNKDTGDLALVLFDELHGSRYLRGVKLACLLNEMVKKGLLVTIVLDCCFSGSVVRLGHPNGDTIRAVDYDSAIDAAYPPCVIGSSPGSQLQLSNTMRDGHVVPTWLVDPNGYSILTACGPHEIARELTFEGGERTGALSYFLLRALTTLQKSNVEITHQSLYQYLRVRFHAAWPQQSPMRYGNENLSFFGKLRKGPELSFVPVFKRQGDNRLFLAAGSAHGVCKDDEYAVYPFELSDNKLASNDTQAPVEVRVDIVQGLTSELVGINSTSATKHIKTGMKARPLTHLAPKKVLVRLIEDRDNQSQWIEATKRKGFLQFTTEDLESQPCLFNVTRNEHNEYEILDGSYQKITSLPKIPLDRKGALESIVNLLEHLAAFKYVEGIENRLPTTSFEESFRIHINDGSGNSVEAAGLLDIKHNSKLSIHVQNFGDKQLYLFIYNLGPSWQIDSLICKDGGGDYKVVLPKNYINGHTGNAKMGVQMSVPSSFLDRGEQTCEDILKVFITNRPSSFVALVLPKIPISPDNIDEPLRGNNNKLSDFLSHLTTPMRGPDGDGITDEEWVARNFVIRTHFDGDDINK